MNGFSRVRITSSFFLLLIAALSLAGCRLDKIDPAAIKVFYAAQVRYNDAMDVKAICNAYTDDASYTINDLSSGTPRITTMNKQQLCDFERSTADAAKAQGITTSTRLTMDSTQIAADGKSADIVATLSETVRLASGQSVTQSSHVKEKIVLIGGKLSIEKTEQWIR